MTEQYNQNVINLALASSSITADSSTDSPLQLPAGNSAVTVDSTRTTALNIDSAPAASNAGAIVSISVDAAATGAVTFREIDASGAVVSTTAVAAGSNVSFVSDGSSWSIPSSNASLTASATGELPLSDASLVNVDITSAGAGTGPVGALAGALPRRGRTSSGRQRRWSPPRPGQRVGRSLGWPNRRIRAVAHAGDALSHRARQPWQRGQRAR